MPGFWQGINGEGKALGSIDAGEGFRVTCYIADWCLLGSDSIC